MIRLTRNSLDFQPRISGFEFNRCSHRFLWNYFVSNFFQTWLRDDDKDHMELCVVFQSPEKAKLRRETTMIEGNKSILRIPSRYRRKSQRRKSVWRVKSILALHFDRKKLKKKTTKKAKYFGLYFWMHYLNANFMTVKAKLRQLNWPWAKFQIFL